MDKRLERRKNVNRGYRKLRTWQMAIELYLLLSEKVKEIPGFAIFHPFCISGYSTFY